MSAENSTLTPVGEFRKSLTELALLLGVNNFEGGGEFSGVTLDSRTVNAGDLFIALPGAKVHGAKFIGDLVARGAVAVVTDSEGARLINDQLPVLLVDSPRFWVGHIASWFYQNPFNSLEAVGITGTNGKTTTASLLDQIWRLDGRASGFIGTIGINVAGEEYSVLHTTPEGTDLQRVLAAMREQHIRNVVMEVSSHALSMRRVSGARFVVVGFTNLTQDHLDFHGDMESYFQAKARLFSSEFADRAIVNVDDSYGARLFNQAIIPTKTLSRTDPKVDWYYQSFTPKAVGVGYEVAIRGPEGILIEGSIPLLGMHNLDNALLAIALAVESGVDPIAVASYLRKLAAPVGRLEPVEVGQKFLALVDYAHTPDAVSRALATARSLTGGRVIAVLGCGGDRDKSKRPIMGEALRKGSDLAIYTSDNPRSEDPLEILAEMVGSVVDERKVVEPNRRSAIATAVLEAEPGDCVIVLGKGHERGQEIMGIKYPFDDRIELARAIEELS